MSFNRKIIRRRENRKQAAPVHDPLNILISIELVREGLAAHQRSDFNGALRKYGEAINLNPTLAEAHYAMGVALQAADSWEEALQAYAMAISLKPDHADAHFYSGLLLSRQGKYANSVKFLQRAVELDPGYTEAYNQLGQALHKLFSFPQAIQAYGAGLKADPEHFRMYYNMGLAQIMLGRRVDASASLEKAFSLNPESITTLSYLVSNKMHLCDWNNIEAQSQMVVDAVMERRAIVDPFTFLVLPTAPGNAQQYACATGFAAAGSAFPRLAARKDQSRIDSRRLEQRRLRVGYVSMDFRSHPMAYLMTDVLQKHDRNSFEVFAYSYGPPDNSPERHKFIEAADHFIDIQDMTDLEAAKRIYEDGIDILIDRKGHTFGERLEIFAHRPAPIQASYLAYPGTMGVEYIDYAIADDFVVPFNQQQFYTERLVYLPYCYQPNSARPVSDITPSRSECGLPDDAFVFCCFNQTYKITPAVYDVWMRILQRTPGSVFWLSKPDETTAANLRREAAARGVDPDRLAFAPKAPQAQHMARHRHVDVFLDTFAVNAITTTSDALLMGVPVISCPGNTFVTRAAGSILLGLEMPELIVNSPREYEDLAVALATSPERLRALREEIALKRKTAPLFDSTRYTRHLDAAYRQMWQLHQAGEAPKPFAVEPIGAK